MLGRTTSFAMSRRFVGASKSANRDRSLYILYSESNQLLSGLGHVINKKTHNDENRDSLICI